MDPDHRDRRPQERRRGHRRARRDDHGRTREEGGHPRAKARGLGGSRPSRPLDLCFPAPSAASKRASVLRATQPEALHYGDPSNYSWATRPSLTLGSPTCELEETTPDLTGHCSGQEALCGSRGGLRSGHITNSS